MLAVLGGCQTFMPVVEPGENQSVSFEPGVPNFVLDAIPFLEESTAGIEIALNAPRSTFVYAAIDSAYVAPVEIIARVMDRRARRVHLEQSWTDTLRAATFEATQTFDLWTWSARVPIDPGSYVLEVDVISVESGGRGERRQRVEVMDPAADAPSLFGVRMLVRRDTSFTPFAGLHLPAGYDSLRAAVELIRAVDGMEVELLLIRHPRDTTAAVAPYYYAPSGWRLERIGIDYDKGTVLQRTVRRLVDPLERLSLQFSLPPLEEGAYEIRIEMRNPGGETVSELGREFMVMPPDFPRITSLDQMIEALIYIARRREFEDIRRAEDPVERRARFDAFWANLIPNRREATNVMQSYYSRIEEANVLFSNYKEGWKTDRGMVYVVVGPPVYRQVEPRREVWRYSYDTTLVPDYIFNRVIATRLNAAFDNFILFRAPEMERLWERYVERWREGRAG